jgi:hypothetical protein
MPLITSQKVPSALMAVLLFSEHIVMDDRCIDISGEYRKGKKLPVSPVMVLYEISLHMCYTECELYMFCLSVNFNRKLRRCELNCRKTNGKLQLVDDKDFIYREISGLVSIIWLFSILTFPHSSFPAQ